MSEFRFYRTYYPLDGFTDPVVIGYERASEKLALELGAYKGSQFIHSGNFWNLKPEQRTPELVLKGQEMLANQRTDGFMSINLLPKDESKRERVRAIRDSLKCADEMLEKKRSQVPLYCALEIIRPEDAVYFMEAIEHGHTHFCLGFGYFLKKYRGLKATLRMLEIIRETKKVIGKAPLHTSGVSSLRLLPIIAWLGVTSSDGSTPVQSALAYGSVFDINGKASRGRDIDAKERVRHNLKVWEQKVKSINDSLRGRTLKESIEKSLKSTYYKKIWDFLIYSQNTE